MAQNAPAPSIIRINSIKRFRNFKPCCHVTNNTHFIKKIINKLIDNSNNNSNSCWGSQKLSKGHCKTVSISVKGWGIELMIPSVHLLMMYCPWWSHACCLVNRTDAAAAHSFNTIHWNRLPTTWLSLKRNGIQEQQCETHCQNQMLFRQFKSQSHYDCLMAEANCLFSPLKNRRWNSLTKMYSAANRLAFVLLLSICLSMILP